MSGIASTQNLALHGTCPIGAIIAFPAAAVPNGWLECSGQAVSRTGYAELFSLISTTYGTGDGASTFNLPDYRGVFLRGKDNGKGYDTGRGFDYQADAFQGHWHERYVTIYNQLSQGSGGLAAELDNNTTTKETPGAANSIRNPATDNTNGTPRTAAETRPKNVSVIFCIKAKNVVITALSTVSTYASLTHTTHQGEATSFAQNGYKRFADGLILQWGWVGTGNTVDNITFPVAFPNAAYSATAVGAVTNLPRMVAVFNLTTTGMSVCKFDYQGLTSSIGCYWRAVGN